MQDTPERKVKKQQIHRPRIMIKSDLQLDQVMAWNFYFSPVHGGHNFWRERAVKHHPDLENTSDMQDQKLFLDTYINVYYREYENDILHAVQEVSRILVQKQGCFFDTVDTIFKKYPWPCDSFTGYVSIFDFCPRFLDDGSFQVFLYDKKQMYLYAVFHEMLHFIFYDYVQKMFPDTIGGMDTEEGPLWDLAEVFNVVMHNTDAFIALHGKVENIGYPVHAAMIIRGEEIWKQTSDVHKWIAMMMDDGGVYTKN